MPRRIRLLAERLPRPQAENATGYRHGQVCYLHSKPETTKAETSGETGGRTAGKPRGRPIQGLTRPRKYVRAKPAIREAAAPGKPLGNRSPVRDWVELSVGYGLILITCWTPNPLQRLLFWVTFAWIIAVLVAAREDWKQMGLGLTNSIRSFWVVGIASAACGVAVGIAAFAHTLHGIRPPLWSHAWGYIVWAFLQQVILQNLVLLRLLRLLPSRQAAVGVAALSFAAAHLPNPALTLLTLVWGTLACLLFLRYRGLFVLGLVHGLLGLSVAIAIPDAVHHHMRVGLGYLTYRPHVHHRHPPFPRQSLPIPGTRHGPVPEQIRSSSKAFSGIL